MEWSLRELEVLVAADRAGSFTDAGALLGISQAAVSRTVARLERRLGTRLLRRTRHGCEPTEAGARLLPQARRVLAEAARLDDLLAEPRPLLRLGYAWAALGAHTTPILRGWTAEHPGTELRLVRCRSASGGLLEGDCDVAVLRNDLDDRRIESVVVGAERRVAAFAADDPAWRGRRVLRMADLASRPVLIDPDAGTTRPEMWPADARPTSWIRTGDVEDWLDAIAAGPAIGSTSEATVVHNPRPGVTFRPVADGPPITVRLAWRRDDVPDGARALVDAVRRRYAGG